MKVPCSYCGGGGVVDKNGNSRESGAAYGEMFPCPQCKGQKEVEMCLIVEDDGEWQEAPLEQAEELEAQGILYHCKDHNGKCLDYYDGKVYHRVSSCT